VKNEYSIQITKPELGQELYYTDWEIQKEDGKHFDLETLYENAMQLYRKYNIDLLKNLIKTQKTEQRI
jgi:hypothetical protein